MFRNCCLTILFILIFEFAEAQWRAQIPGTIPVDTLYSLSTDPVFDAKSISFHFPEYDFHVSELRGINLVQGLKDGASATFSLRYARISDEELKKDNCSIYFHFFTDNIKTITFSLLINNKWHSKSFSLPQNGYQIPFDISLRSLNDSTYRVFEADNNQSFKNGGSRLLITCKATDSLKTVNLIAQDLIISHTKIVDFYSTHKFFTDTYKYTPDKQLTSFDNRYPSEFVLHASNDLRDFRTQLGEINLVQQDTSINEIQAFDTLLMKAVNNYLFFTTKKINKKRFISYLKTYMDTVLYSSFNEYSIKLSTEINYAFKDPHFKIVPEFLSNIPLSKSPVRLYQIQGKYEIAAILDPVYKDKLNIGDQVTDIDGIPIEARISYELSKINPTLIHESADRQTILNSILDRYRTDSLLLRVKTISGFKNVTLHYKNKLVIPQNFRPIHCEFKMLQPDIAYYYINIWDSPVYSRLISKWDSIKKCEKLIIDLRGNGGGDKFSVIELYSLFIDKPSTLYKYKPYSSLSYDSLVIKPNPYFRFALQKQVDILIDNATACASEVFIMAMKSLPNVTIIGSDNTMGAMASSVKISFPSGVKLHVNSLYDFPHFNKSDIDIEMHGIAPDILVKPQTVFDLRPFNDIILQKAILNNANKLTIN